MSLFYVFSLKLIFVKDVTLKATGFYFAESAVILTRLCSIQVPRGARRKWKAERRENRTRSHSWLNLRMNFWWMSSSTDRNGKSCQTDWTWATNRWKYGFRTAGWRRNDCWCANRLSPRTDDLWTWSWPAARRICAAALWMLQHMTSPLGSLYLYKKA